MNMYSHVYAVSHNTINTAIFYSNGWDFKSIVAV